MSEVRTLGASEASCLLQEKGLRDRLTPTPGAKLYLHLADLRQAIGMAASEMPVRILDFGCGGSPYRSLFPNADYRRADLAGMESLDYTIIPGTPLPAEDHSFDMILSTQVLEHVEDYAGYLQECHRLLKPGGKLVLSTHGTFPDHGAPWDFQRWTPHGLSRDLQGAGFVVDSQVRLTTGARAVLQLWELYMEGMPGRGDVFGLMFRILRGLTRRRRAALHRWADQFLSDCRTADAKDAPAHRLYLGLLIQATAR